MTRILITADLHLDLWLVAGRDPLAALDTETWSGLDALIIAGDLANKPKTRWPKLLAQVSPHIKPARVHIFPGNHDHYDDQLDNDGRLERICTEAGVRFAQKREIVLGRTRLLCCTLWTDFALRGDPARAMRLAGQDMNDYRHIRLSTAGHRRTRPIDTAFLHAEHRAWLKTRLAAPFDGRTVVVTHHGPHPDLLGERHGDLDPAYASDLRPVIDRCQPDAWFFGHTHHPAEIRQGRTLIRNVSLGYPHEVTPRGEGRLLRRGLVDLSDARGEE